MSGYLARLAFGFACKLLVVLQTEAAECGWACLASVLGFHGFHTDLRRLRVLRLTAALQVFAWSTFFPRSR